ncbi:hypothetical protein [Mucilaginibacter celer]|uniref:Uncharacterized protein n=1 Tax=Mucilaginibacter celer TaxID=2305508 RepID=A0A494VK75_9SPHI|nr:hypothetical protein [Mucilaginibacter celer]AYL94329.1 hypothetical protein HYN43_003025 [Mucilaginibacter celer]
MKTERPSKKLNGSITRCVIELQDKGFHFDYLALSNKHLYCVQSSELISAENASVRLVDLGYDYLFRCIKYVHTVETYNGESGLLITDGIFFEMQVAEA